MRIRWVTDGVAEEDLRPENIWELDGFIVAETDGIMTVLDTDLWTRKVSREPSPGWKAEVLPLDLREVGVAATSRLRALVGDPGAVERVEHLFRGVRLACGDEGQALALARHLAENSMDREAHELLEAARALPPLPGAPEGAALEAVVATQIDEAILWRILYDFSDETVARARLLERFRGWRAGFPGSPHQERARDAVPLLEAMVASDAERDTTIDPASIPAEQRAQHLVDLLCDQTGDVYMTRAGRVSIDVRSAPASALLRMGTEATPALIDALTDARFTRAVLFIQDMTFSRQVVARVGDIARVLLEQIHDKASWDVPWDEPSMFQHDAQGSVQANWRTWLAPTEAFTASLATLANETDPEQRAKLAAALPDRGTGSLPGASGAVWGTKSFADALPDLDEEGTRRLLADLLEHAPHPRTKTLAAWMLLDLGEKDVVAAVGDLWRELPDDVAGDLEQGGTVASFLIACDDPAAVAILAEGLDERSAKVRSLVVLACLHTGLGAVRGPAASPPDGVREPWPESAATKAALLDLVAGRLKDTVEDPHGLLPRQEPLCDMVDEYDCGRRIADAAIRVLARRWPEAYAMQDEPVFRDVEWEAMRTSFISTYETAREAR